jgi:transposase
MRDPRRLNRAVRMVFEVAPSYDSQWAAIKAVVQKLAVGTAETVRKWVGRAEFDAGQRAGTTSEESTELKRLRRENAELRRANEILKAASAFFAAALAARADKASASEKASAVMSSAPWAGHCVRPRGPSSGAV